MSNLKAKIIGSNQLWHRNGVYLCLMVRYLDNHTAEFSARSSDGKAQVGSLYPETSWMFAYSLFSVKLPYPARGNTKYLTKSIHSQFRAEGWTLVREEELCQ